MMLSNLDRKNFQLTLASYLADPKNAKQNFAVELPYGTGKTYVGALYMALKDPKRKFLVIVPSKLLRAQWNIVLSNLEVKGIFENKPSSDILDYRDRAILYQLKGADHVKKTFGKDSFLKESKVVISTSRGLTEDIIRNRISSEVLLTFTSLIIDEGHNIIASDDLSSDSYRKNEDYSAILKEMKHAQLILLSGYYGDDSRLKKLLHFSNSSLIHMIVPESEIPVQSVSPIQIKDPSEFIPSLCQAIESIINRQKNGLKSLFKSLGINKSVESFYYKRSEAIKRFLSTIQVRSNQDINEIEKQFIGYIASLSALERLLKTIYEGTTKIVTDSLKRLGDSRKGEIADILLLEDFSAIIKYISKQRKEKKEFEKIERLLNLICLDVETYDRKVVVYTSLRKNADDLGRIAKQNRNIYQSYVITGQTKDQVGELLKFQEEDGAVLFITDVGREGLDLPMCDKMYFLSYSLNPVFQIQRQARIRDGEVIYLNYADCGEMERYKKLQERLNYENREGVVLEEITIELDKIWKKITSVNCLDSETTN